MKLAVRVVGGRTFRFTRRRAARRGIPLCQALLFQTFLGASACLALGPPLPAEAAMKKARARPAGAADMETVVRSAARHHPAIAEATGVMRQQQEQIAVARSGYFPKIAAGVGSGASATGNQNWRPALNISASQMLYDFGKVSSEVEAASAGARASVAQVALTTDNIARDAALAFVEAQRYQALFAVAVEQVAGVRAIGDLVTQRSQEGASSLSDKEQAEARILATEATRYEVEGERSRWLSNVSFLSSLSVSSVAASAPAWLGKSCASGELDWGRIPAAVQAEEKRRQAIAQLDNSKAQLFPTIALSGSADYDPFYEREPAWSYNNNTNTRRFNYTAGVRVSGNLYEGGATEARRRAADYALTAAMAAGAAVRLQVRQGLAQARSRIGALGAQHKAAKLRDAAMIKTRDLYRQQYVDLGTRTLLDLLNAEQELYTARFQAVNITHDLRRLQVECLYNTGMTRAAFALSTQAGP